MGIHYTVYTMLILTALVFKIKSIPFKIMIKKIVLFYAKKGLAGIYIYIYYHNIIANTSPYQMYNTTLTFIEYLLPEKITLTECKKWRQTQFPYIAALAIISSLILIVSNVLVQYSRPSFPHESPNKSFHCLIQRTSQDIKHA